jgi:hypothetical protein
MTQIKVVRDFGASLMDWQECVNTRLCMKSAHPNAVVFNLSFHSLKKEHGT